MIIYGIKCLIMKLLEIANLTFFRLRQGELRLNGIEELPPDVVDKVRLKIVYDIWFNSLQNLTSCTFSEVKD